MGKAFICVVFDKKVYYINDIAEIDKIHFIHLRNFFFLFLQKQLFKIIRIRRFKLHQFSCNRVIEA